MLADLAGQWQEVYAHLRGGNYGIWGKSIVVGVDMELVVIAESQYVGDYPASHPGIPANSFITRYCGNGWVIAATARRLPVPGWPPGEQEIPGVLS